VAVVELNPEHAAAQGFGDFAVKLNRLVLLADCRSVRWKMAPRREPRRT
jgi:hypothetical protein